MAAYSQYPFWKRVLAHVWLYLVCTGALLFSLFVSLEVLYRDEACSTGGVDCALGLVPCLALIFCALGCYAAVPFLGHVIHPAELYRHVDGAEEATSEAEEASEEEASEDELAEGAPAAAAHDEASQGAQEENSVREEASQEDVSREESSQEGVQEDAAEEDYSLGWCAFYYLCVIMVLSVLIHRPFTDLNALELIEKGVAGKQAPGWASINCMTDVRPKSIDVRTDVYSYFALADPQWRVASENGTRVAKKGDDSWVVAPILYDGPVTGCRTKYPLFAVCVARTKSISPAACGWDNARTGTWTPILLMTASGDFVHDERKVFWEERVPNPYNSSETVTLHHENLFQYGSDTYGDAVAYLEEKRNGFPSLRLKAIVAWFIATLPVALWTITVYSKSVTAPPATQQPDGSGDEEMWTQPSEPDEPLHPEDEVLLMPAEPEENIEVESQVTRL